MASRRDVSSRPKERRDGRIQSPCDDAGQLHLDLNLADPQLIEITSGRRHAARGMRGIRHLRPSRRRRHHRARAARLAASRPGGRGHRLLRWLAVSFRTPARPGRRHLFPPRSDRTPAGQLRGRPYPLLHHRRDHPAQRAAAVRRAQRRRFCGRPQWQSHQRADAAPRPCARRRHDAVHHRYRSDPAPGRAVARNRFIDRFIEALRAIEGAYRWCR